MSREAIIFRPLGRTVYLAELKNWRNKIKTFDSLVEELRNYLYSPAGDSDLRETVKRKYFSQYNRQSTPDESEKLIKQYRSHRNIFSEMYFDGLNK